MRMQVDKIGGENDSDVFHRNRPEDAPETRIKSFSKPRQGKEREEVGAENPDPEEHHRAARSSRDVNDPKDESDVDKLCRSEGKNQARARAAPIR
jgi:hypothetical protein